MLNVSKAGNSYEMSSLIFSKKKKKKKKLKYCLKIAVVTSKLRVKANFFLQWISRN